MMKLWGTELYLSMYNHRLSPEAVDINFVDNPSMKRGEYFMSINPNHGLSTGVGYEDVIMEISIIGIDELTE
jgi:hypothetical protein